MFSPTLTRQSSIFLLIAAGSPKGGACQPHISIFCGTRRIFLSAGEQPACLVEVFLLDAEALSAAISAGQEGAERNWLSLLVLVGVGVALMVVAVAVAERRRQVVVWGCEQMWS